MRWLISTSLHLRVAVLVLAGLLVFFGLSEVRRAPLDVFPEFAPPLVEIQTEAPGLSTTEVESLISSPIENAVNGVIGLKTLAIQKCTGIVVCRADSRRQCRPAQDPATGAGAAGDRQLHNCLPYAKPPVILSPLSSTSRVMKIGLSSKTLTQVEMSTLARWTIRPRLMAVPGVANVAIWGQRDRQFQVLVNPDRLRDHGVTLNEVMQATRDAVSPAAGGFIDTPNQRLAVAQRALVAGVDELQEVPVTFRGGFPIRVRDVARVVEGFPQPIGDAVINDGPGHSAHCREAAHRQYAGCDTQCRGSARRSSSRIEGSRSRLHDLPACNFHRDVPGESQSGASVRRDSRCHHSVAFLFEWRTALISLTALPLSLISAALVIRYMGQTINTMVLAGLAIALGEVVDDAIIDVENIVRRLRLNRAAGNPSPRCR